MASQEHIVIVGGGFAGMRTAKLLEGKAKVTLVTKEDRFTYIPLLHEIVSKNEEGETVTKPLSSILRQTNLVFDEAVKVEGNDLHLASGDSIHFDKLVVAIGGKTATFGVPGVLEHAMTFYSVDDAEKVRTALEDAAATVEGRPVRVLIAGASFTGVEVAGEIRELFDDLKVDAQIDMVELMPGIFGRQAAAFQEGAWKLIADQKLNVLLEHGIKEIQPGKMIVENNGERKELEGDVVLWCAGAQPCMLDGVDGTVDMTLKSASRDDVFFVGDAALFPREAGVPRLAQTAEMQAPIVAYNVLHPESMKTYEPKLKGVLLSVGQNKAVLEAGPVVLTGMIPWQMKKRMYKAKLFAY